MLELVNNVKFLHMDSIDCSLLDPYRIEVLGPYVFPMFQNLTHIKLQYVNYNDDWSEVVELLKYCPNLQVIVIDQQPNFYAYVSELSEEEPENWPYTPSFPECILLHLEECYLNDYRGTKGEFQFARHVMQNGRSLKKMTTCSGDFINQQGRLELIEKLSSCTRHSATCELYFELQNRFGSCE
ncbi:F-box/FBD/LRR-repeat protein At3g26920-like [Lotus japonicus]|uniref:F-box/FBD/LRR-repeat protein At3g26920-like n=1 Tax=Lotus japonicus TaxID=34305 RepID=UPI00258BD4C7|nr:F-box/FBD/LRR-repeat protein At3g26920-like [Lotus japonicus]